MSFSNWSDISKGDMAVQVVSDGPDNDESYMRNGLVRLMMLARKRVWIQTPYLIPDEAMIAAWQILASSGVDLRIMIPCMPDHPFIYRATQWYANQLVKIRKGGKLARMPKKNIMAREWSQGSGFLPRFFSVSSAYFLELKKSTGAPPFSDTIAL